MNFLFFTLLAHVWAIQSPLEGLHGRIPRNLVVLPGGIGVHQDLASLLLLVLFVVFARGLLVTRVAWKSLGPAGKSTGGTLMNVRVGGAMPVFVCRPIRSG